MWLTLSKYLLVNIIVVELVFYDCGYVFKNPWILWVTCEIAFEGFKMLFSVINN